MTNYGVKWNETPKTPLELRRFTEKTGTQLTAEAVLRFIEDGKPTVRNQDVREPIPGDVQMPWVRNTGIGVEFEPPKPKWLANLLDSNPPWYRRLWRWLDPRKQFRDWDRR